MTKELEDSLFEKYPSIFQERTLSPKDTCMCWGIECPDGWYGMIDNLCKELQFIENEWDVKVICCQIKEKWGTLRFYHEEEYGKRWGENKKEDGTAVITFDGKEDINKTFNNGWESGDPSTPDKEFEKRLDWIINRYETLSGDICCECGTYSTFGNPIICTKGSVSYICKKCWDKNTAEREAKIKKEQEMGMTPSALMFGANFEVESEAVANGEIEDPLEQPVTYDVPNSSETASILKG